MADVVILPIVEEGQKIIALAHDLMKPFEATQWLHCRNAKLDGHSPITAIKAGRSTDVWSLLKRMET